MVELLCVPERWPRPGFGTRSHVGEITGEEVPFVSVCVSETRSFVREIMLVRIVCVSECQTV